MLQESEINELIGRFKRDADFDMGDDSMIAAVTMEELLNANKELTKQRAELLEALKKCLEKGSRWHVCDQVVIQSKQAIANAEK